MGFEAGIRIYQEIIFVGCTFNIVQSIIRYWDWKQEWEEKQCEFCVG